MMYNNTYKKAPEAHLIPCYALPLGNSESDTKLYGDLDCGTTPGEKCLRNTWHQDSSGPQMCSAIERVTHKC